MKYPILRFFDYVHLPPELRDASRPFHHLAWLIAENSPPGAEVSAGLRKLLEAKDCIVRSHIPKVAEDKDCIVRSHIPEVAEDKADEIAF